MSICRRRRTGLYNPAAGCAESYSSAAACNFWSSAAARRRLLQDFHVHHLEYYANQTYTLTRITP
jgi:hypothetical protein